MTPACDCSPLTVQKAHTPVSWSLSAAEDPGFHAEVFVAMVVDLETTRGAGKSPDSSFTAKHLNFPWSPCTRVLTHYQPGFFSMPGRHSIISVRLLGNT